MPETLYLIDGHAQIFRAFFAIRNGMRSAVTGEPTHAVYGFTGMLLKLLKQFKPEYVAVAMDMPGPTFRDELYSDYKATRNATPEDLTAQVPRVRELIQHFGMPIVGVPGLEADDVIATIVTRILNDPQLSHMHIRIVSKDKDLEQLLCDRVSLFDIHTNTTLDHEMLFQSKGIHPHNVIDYLALIGDTADNVPGVPGIGPKTAAALLQQHGGIPAILDALHTLSPKQRACFESGADQLQLSRTLVTLKCDADFPFTLADARCGLPNGDALIALFQQLGFGKYQDEIKRMTGIVTDGLFTHGELFTATDAAEAESSTASDVPAEPEVPLADASTGHYTAITTREQLDKLIETLRAQPLISVDTETTGLERDAALCGISLSYQPGHGVYIPVRSPNPAEHLDTAQVLEAMKPLLESPSVAKCGHNLKFDARVLKHAGIRLRGIVMDTLQASTLANPSEAAHKLDHLARVHLGYRMIPLDTLIGPATPYASIDQVPLDQVTPYAAEDADIALQLCLRFTEDLAARGMSGLMSDAEGPLTAVLAEMEYNGILCDAQELMRQGEILGQRAAELRQTILDTAGVPFNVESPSQLAKVLFEDLGLKPGKKTKTGYSTDVSELERLAALEDAADPKTSVPRLITEYRQLTKLIGTYLGNLQAAIHPATGRIHTTFHQNYTATGRLASQNPNLQNIPIRSDLGRQIRKAFTAPPDHVLICADYSQIELRLLAHLSGDQALLEAFAQGVDIHTAVAAQVFDVPIDQVSREQRAQAKTINFGIIYGISAFGLARRIGGMDTNAAAALINDYKVRFPGIDRFLQECIQTASDLGYVSTLLGRRRAIPEILSSNRNTRTLGERLAINSVVQGSAADLIKLAMVAVQNRIDRDQLPMRLLLQIHDELVLEAPADLAAELSALVCDDMARAMTLRVPLVCSAGIGTDWYSAK